MYQLRIVSGSSYTQVSWSNSIDLISVVNICFAGIYISMCRAVDDCIRFYLFCQFHNSFNICNIQLCHICIHTFILSAVCIHLVDCPSQLTVTASHNNLLHILIIPFCLYTLTTENSRIISPTVFMLYCYLFSKSVFYYLYHGFQCFLFIWSITVKLYFITAFYAGSQYAEYTLGICSTLTKCKCDQ